MMQIEALRLLILGIDYERIDGNFGPAGAVRCIPQQGASESEAMIGEINGKASQARDRNRRIAWQTPGKPGWHLREENPARS